MIVAVANVSTYVDFAIRDAAGDAVEGAILSDFLEAPVALLLPDGEATATPTLTELGEGGYCAVFAELAAGDWRYSHRYDADALPFSERIHVLPAAADPAAIATAIAEIMDQPSAGYDAGTIGYEIHALFKRPVGSG